jgi:hypothetical protein
MEPVISNANSGMKLNLNFGDVIETESTPLEAGMHAMRIISAEFCNRSSPDKNDYVKIVVSPYVNPADSNATRKITSIFTMSPKNYPRLLFKTFLEAVFNTQVETLELDLNDLVNRTVKCDVAIEENSWVDKNSGQSVTRDVNKIKGWYPEVSTGAKLL